MCTVSFIPKNNTYYITSNRDEHSDRPSSLQPKLSLINGIKVVYPKDPKAGGTWFAVNEHGATVVLLNGAFENHVSKGPYRISRGLVVLRTVSAEDSLKHALNMDFEQIEPFTLIVFHHKKLTEIRWDGVQKYVKELDIMDSHIWSSATLYNKEAINAREALFAEFLTKHKDYNSDDVIDFHRTNNEDYENGFVIDRASGLKTFSITQAVLDEKGVVLAHLDLLNEQQYSLGISQEQPQDLLS